MSFEAEFWVAVSFVIFLAVLGYFGVHRRLLGAIDQHCSRIGGEFEDARQLKSEAGAVLKTAERRLQQVNHEVNVIVGDAQFAAEHLVADARAKAEELMARRTRHAEARIALAENRAVAEIKAMAVDVAVNAAAEILSATLHKNRADQILARDIADLETRFRNVMS